MGAAGKFFVRGKTGVKFFIFTIVIADWLSCALAITNAGNGNKSESKLKKEENRRTLNDYQTDLKPFPTSSKEEISRSSRYRQPPGNTKNKDRYSIKDRERDSVAANSGYYDKRYGLSAPAEDAVAGYGYQDFDQSPHYGPPIPDRGPGEGYGGGGYDGGGGGGYGGGGGGGYGDGGGSGGYQHTYEGHHDYEEYQDHREHGLQPGYHHVAYHQPQQQHHGLGLKGILLPLAGVALLGVAASLVTHPVLLQLGVISGRKRRSLAQDIFKSDQSSTIETFTQLKEPFKTFGYEKPAKYLTNKLKSKKETQKNTKKQINKTKIPKKVVELNRRQPKDYFFTKRPTTEDINRPIHKTKKSVVEGQFRRDKTMYEVKEDLVHFRKKRATNLTYESNRTVDLSPKINISPTATTKEGFSVDERDDSFMDTDDYDDVKHDVNIYHPHGRTSNSSSVDFYDSN